MTRNVSRGAHRTQANARHHLSRRCAGRRGGIRRARGRGGQRQPCGRGAPGHAGARAQRISGQQHAQRPRRPQRGHDRVGHRHDDARPKDPNNGVLNIAGGAPPCWTGGTPQILPGDEVTVDDGGTGLDSTIVQNVGATSLGQDPDTGHILVHGYAIAPGGGEYDAATFAASVQARITIAATGTPFSNATQQRPRRRGQVRRDGVLRSADRRRPAPTTWTADFPMSDLDAQLALGNKDFEGVFLVGVNELTIGRTPAGASGVRGPGRRLGDELRPLRRQRVEHRHAR